MRRGSASLLAVAAFLGLASEAPADVITVPGDSATIQGAEDLAGAGDTIEIRKAKIYPENVEVGVADLTIVGTKPGVRIDAAGGGGGPGIDALASGFELENVTVLHGEGLVCTGVGCSLRDVNVAGALNDICARVTGVDAEVVSSRFSGCANNDVGGLRVTGTGAIVTGNKVRGSANGCIAVIGTDALVKGNQVANCDTNYGIQVSSAGGRIIRNSVRASRGDAFELLGDDQRLTGNTAVNTGDNCFELNGNLPVAKRNTGSNCGDFGILTRGDNPEIVLNTISDTGQDAFRIDCTLGGVECLEGSLVGNSATGANVAGVGFRVDDSFGPFDVSENTAKNNSGGGYDLEVSGASVDQNIAKSNGSNVARHGMFVRGDNNVVDNNNASSNTGDGIAVDGEVVTISENTTNGNGADGIDIRAPFPGIELERNVAKNNGTEGFDNGGDGTDARRNEASGNLIDCATDFSNLGLLGENQTNDCDDGSDFTVQSSDFE